jgi:AcrR family transcriptional regulator
MNRGDEVNVRERRKKELKELIFQKSVELFAEKGFDQVSVDEITKACGVSKGTFYNYFPSKQAVLLYLGSSQMELVLQAIEESSGDEDLKERLLKVFGGLFSRLGEKTELMKLVMRQFLNSSTLMSEEYNTIVSFHQSLVKLLTETCNLQEAASLLIACYFQLVMTWLSSDLEISVIQTSFEEQLNIIWEGIQRR